MISVDKSNLMNSDTRDRIEDMFAASLDSEIIQRNEEENAVKKRCE